MKVLQITVHYAPNIGGVETHLTDLVIGLTKKITDTFVLAYRPLVAKTRWKIFERKSHLTILRIPWLPGFFYRFAKQPIIEFLYLTPGLFLITPFVVMKVNPDIIHSHGLVAGLVGVVWGKVFNKKIIISTHSMYNFPKSGIYYHLAKWIFTHANSVLCLSNKSMEEINNLGVSLKKVSRFTYWIDMAIFRPLQKQKIKSQLGWQDKFVVLFIGRLVKEKGILELLEAAKKLDDTVLIAIVGDGPLKNEIKNQKSKIKNLEFLGKIDNKKLPIYYNGADVVIVPSTHEEGFGRVVLEALACGTPVICSRRGALPEAMDKSVGLLIDISPEEIARSIKYLQKSKNLLNKFSKNATLFAKEKYSKKNIEQITNIYLAL